MKRILRITCAAALVALLAAVLLQERSAAPSAPRSPTLRPAGSFAKAAAAPRVSSDGTTPLPPAALNRQAPGKKLPPAPVTAWLPGNFPGRSAEESIMSSWAARDPEAAGRWLNQNRDHPKFADYVRGYAIQIAVIDPNAARQWAARLNGHGNRFARGGTLEQHIDAVEAMLKTPAVPPADIAAIPPPPDSDAQFLVDYTPVLVRQNPGEDPVLEMNPVSPFG
jgi:hypothetical protein